MPQLKESTNINKSTINMNKSESKPISSNMNFFKSVSINKQTSINSNPSEKSDNENMFFKYIEINVKNTSINFDK